MKRSTVAQDLRGITGRLLVAAHVLAAAAAALVVVLVYLRPMEVGSFDEVAGTLELPVRGHGGVTLVFWLALALLVADLWYLLRGRQPRQPLRHVISDVEGGTVKVSRDALETGLRTAGESLLEITRLRVIVEQPGLKRLLVRAQFQAPEGVTILEASSMLRLALAQRFHELIRLAEGWRVDYDMEFVGFQGKYQKPVTDVESSIPFTGPQYPIDDEDPFESKRSG